MSVFEVKYNDDFIQKGNDYLIDNPKAHLLIITGMDEHSSRYEGFAHELNEKGFSVSVLDHWGQGENAKSIEEQQQWPKGAWKMTQASLNKKVEELKKEGIPVYLMGHSMGSFAVQNYLINYPDTVHKAIIMASNGKNNKFLISIGNMMAKLLTTKKNWNKHAKFLESMSVGAYAKSIKDRESDLDWLSYDKENIKNYAADPYCGHENTFGFFHEFMEGLNEIYKKKNLKRISKNEHILLLAGEEDPVGACGKGPKALLKMYKDLGVKDVSRVLYPHMRHEILNETERDKVVNDIIEFLEK